jgi:hypothetical protein
VSIFTRPKVRFQPDDDRENPVEATLQTDGRICLMTDPDSMHIHRSWLTPAEIREFATELLGLADASDAIYGDYEER